MDIPFRPPWRPPADKQPRLGRLSPVDVEVSDSVGDWYYFGRVEMWEREYELRNEAQDGLFHCKRCSADFTLPAGSRHCTHCGGFVSGVDSKAEKTERKKLHFYRLLTKFREDEKVIVTDRDFVQNGNQIPYTQTRRGRNRMFQVIMIAFGMVYALTLYVMALFIQAGPSIVYYTQQVSSLEWDVGNIAFVFVFGALVWAWAARYHHMVLDWEIQPLRINSVRVSTDFYILTNSSKLPAYETVLELAKLKGVEIDRMVAAVRGFAKHEIDMLQEEVGQTHDELDVTYSAGFANALDGLERGLATKTQRIREKRDTVKVVFMLAAVSVVSLIVGIIASGVM